MVEASVAATTETPVSLGYDRIRFLGPVFIGDTVTVRYEIKAVDTRARRSRAELKITNQDDELVVVGEHILKWVPNTEDDR
jgi:acyl dehydratase